MVKVTSASIVNGINNNHQMICLYQMGPRYTSIKYIVQIANYTLAQLRR